MAKGRFIMIGRGLNLRSAVYITDFLDALERCATQPGIEGEVFIVTHNERVTVGQIVDEIARLVGKPRPRLRIPVGLAWGGAALMESLAGSLGRQPPITRRSLKFFTNDAGFTCAKAQRLLGFEPQVPLRVGLELTYRWWRENTGGS
jgi:nucleoside-diphosphate-sugar epimerase